jgi:hypothetical protein
LDNESRPVTTMLTAPFASSVAPRDIRSEQKT